MGSTLGALKSAATKTGCTLHEYLQKIKTGFGWCFRCRTWKPLKLFSIDKTRPRGRAATCKACTSEASTASRYKMSRKKLKDLRESKNGTCGICERKKILVVDHDHGTGKVRDLICNRCNRGLGLFEDSIDLMKKAIEYLEAHRG